MKVTQIIENGFILTTPVLTPKVTKKHQTSLDDKIDVSTLKQGQLVSGVIRSLKGQCAFLQLSNMKQLVIGRLHKLESSSNAEFEGFSVGENIKAKILKVSQGKY